MATPKTGQNTPPPEDRTQEEEETVSISKTLLDQLTERLDVLETTQDSHMAKTGVLTAEEEEEIKTPTARIRFIEEVPIKGFGKSMIKYDAQKKQYVEMEVIDLNDKTHKVNMNEFMEDSVTELVKIIEINQKPEIKKGAAVYANKVDFANYKTESTDRLVTLTTKKIIRTFVIERENGQQIVMPETGMNI